ncbi:MAG: PilW family protein [Alteromonadaceae bacterium]|nr:PilW family protein [Alteromonadaceae bacterium]
MAGYYGCLMGEPTDHLKKDSSYYNDELYDFDRAAVGWEASNTGLGKKYTMTELNAGSGNWTNGSNDTLPAVISNKAIPGTDVLVVGSVSAEQTVEVAGVSGENVKTNGSTDIDKGRIVVVVMGDCSGAERFQKRNNANGNDLTRGGGSKPGNDNSLALHSHTGHSRVYTYHSTGFYIGEGVNDEPALFRVNLDPGTSSTPIELVSGVESMQVLYGLKAQNQRAVARYVTANSVTDWRDVVSVRVALLMRSGDKVLDENSSQTFNLAGTEIDPGTDRRVRLVATTTIGIRNRLE